MLETSYEIWKHGGMTEYKYSLLWDPTYLIKLNLIFPSGTFSNIRDFPCPPLSSPKQRLSSSATTL